MRLPGSIGELLAQAQRIQQTVAETQAELEKRRIEGSAGGSMVNVVADGTMRLLSVRIDPALAQAGDAEMLQDLVCAAVNDALGKAKEQLKAEFSRFAGGLSIPGLG
ncbi:MAG TPA: YbaB/EbfC family nucleoid-associated protein [Oligoflexia bacterium]|nr:YbaB/EbfC family nucleoid-associated protein [Oligoflexia bacterium]